MELFLILMKLKIMNRLIRIFAFFIKCLNLVLKKLWRLIGHCRDQLFGSRGVLKCTVKEFFWKTLQNLTRKHRPEKGSTYRNLSVYFAIFWEQLSYRIPYNALFYSFIRYQNQSCGVLERHCLEKFRKAQNDAPAMPSQVEPWSFKILYISSYSVERSWRTAWMALPWKAFYSSLLPHFVTLSSFTWTSC